LPLAVNAARTPLFILSLARALGRTAGSFQLPSLIRGTKDIGAMPTPSQRRAKTEVDKFSHYLFFFPRETRVVCSCGPRGIVELMCESFYCIVVYVVPYEPVVIYRSESNQGIRVSVLYGDL